MLRKDELTTFPVHADTAAITYRPVGSHSISVVISGVILFKIVKSEVSTKSKGPSALFNCAKTTNIPWGAQKIELNLFFSNRSNGKHYW